MTPKRIGIVVPSTNTSVEADFQRVATEAVSVHSARLFIPDGDLTEAALNQMNDSLDSAVRLLASARVDVIAYACTSGSFYKGPQWDESVMRQVQEIASVPCVTTSSAVAQALQAAKAQRLSVVSPYPEWTNAKLRAYYERAGFVIDSIQGDPRSCANGHRGINDQDPAEIVEFALAHVNENSDALFCSCTAWRAVECVEELERQTGLPVVTSNQATIWAAARAVDALPDMRPVGKLFLL